MSCGSRILSIKERESFVKIAKPLDPKEIVTTEEIVITNMVEISALIELLIEKGIITQDELMERCERLRGKMRGK